MTIASLVLTLSTASAQNSTYNCPVDYNNAKSMVLDDGTVRNGIYIPFNPGAYVKFSF